MKWLSPATIHIDLQGKKQLDLAYIKINCYLTQ